MNELPISSRSILFHRLLPNYIDQYEWLEIAAIIASLVVMELLGIKSTFPTRIICRGVSGFMTSCSCGVWFSELTVCPLYVGPLFHKAVLDELVCKFNLICWRIALFIIYIYIFMFIYILFTDYLSLFYFIFTSWIAFKLIYILLAPFPTDASFTLSVLVQQNYFVIRLWSFSRWAKMSWVTCTQPA